MGKNNNALSLSRELGYAVVASIQHQNLIKAQDAVENNKELSQLIKDLQIIENEIYDSNNIEKTEDNNLFKEYKQTKGKLDDHPLIKDLNNCQEEYDNIFNNITNIIEYITGRALGKGKCGGCKGCNK